MEIAGDPSFFAAVQLSSDKSHVSLKAGTLSIYPLHIRTLNFLEKCRWVQTIENRTLVAYLPFFHESTNDHDRFPSLNPFQKNYGRAELLQSPHKSVECAFEELLFTALFELIATSSDVHKYLGHSMKVSYIADIPEAERYAPPIKGKYDQYALL